MEFTVVDACVEDDRCCVTVAMPSVGPNGEAEFTERHFRLPVEIALADAETQRKAVREAIRADTAPPAPVLKILKILGETLKI